MVINFKSIPVLTREECEQNLEIVFKLRDEWHSRSNEMSDLEDLEYYSIGAMSYLDEVPQLKQYSKMRDRFNPILLNNFKDLLEQVRQAIAKHLDTECYFDDNYALPGIHIFGTDWLFESEFAPKHCDLHYAMMDWGDIEFDPEDNLSFTLALKLPSNGGGLYSWDEFFTIKRDDGYESNKNRMFETELNREDSEFHDYESGRMYLHSGNQFHQIAPFKDIQEGDMRITLQGHGILNKQNGKYLLFW